MNGYFDYNERAMTASNGRITYHLGDKINVKVIYANREDRRVDFRIEDSSNEYE